TAANLPAGAYTVTITDANTCTATASATISQPAVLTTNATATAQTGNGLNNGTATAAPAGGTSSYSYAWSNSGNTAGITGLAPGAYTVTVTDSHSCTAVQTVTVNSFNCSLSSSITATNVICQGAANGTASLVLTGAALPVTYLWSNGAMTASISGLAPGNYTVSATDANGCPVTGNASITEPATLMVNATATAVTAANATDGTATAQPSGGTLPYTYLWSTGATTATITGLAAGTYTPTVTDANGCTSAQAVTVNAFNCTLLSSISTTNSSCPASADGSATAVLAGGSAPYSYTWSTGANTATAANLLAGVYTVTISDAASCITTASATVISVDTIAPVLSCPGGIFLCGADIVAYPPPVASDNCTLTAAPILMSGQASGTAFDDGVTTQVFSITDASGNAATCSFAVTVFPVPDILIDSTKNDSGNNGVGSIAVSAVGGVGPYIFVWKKDGVFFSNDEDLTGLLAGIYTLTMSDVHGCQVNLAPITIDNIVGITSLYLQPSVQVWPNPANTGIWVKTANLTVFSVTILSAQGQLVQNIRAAEWNDFIAVEGLANGIYYLKIVDARGKTWVVKWIKAE
ncbi:MAG: T9SS type A sorting domain-containing protein, partial [Saprospiraceae bacterium]